ncbi:MAG: cupin domain-containing protein [Thermomicrobiales bacterium]
MISTAPLKTCASPYESFSLMGVRITPKVIGSETAGQFSMVEAVVAPGAGDTANITRSRTKVFYVASGEFEFLLGTITKRLSAGDTIFIPAGAIHRFQNVGTVPGTLFTTFTPAGYETFLRELSDLFQGEDVRPEDVAALAQEYGVEAVD